jgi:hypothetical protein
MRRNKTAARLCRASVDQALLRPQVLLTLSSVICKILSLLAGLNSPARVLSGTHLEDNSHARWTPKTPSTPMSTRLQVRLVIACVALGIFVIVKMINPTRVTFSPANMSINPGKGCKEVKIPATAAVCSPRLICKSGMINALVLNEDLTDAKAAAEKLQASLVSAGKASADAFQQQDFTTESGLPGVHFSYTGKSANSDKPDVRSHRFITRNMHGRCISISYITSPEQESSALIAAIIMTLRVE